RLVRQVVDVLAEIDTNYVKELSDEDREKLVEAMINGGLRDLDPHSEYLNAEQRKRFESDAEGSFGGVGITLATDPSTKFLKVDHPMPGTPAYDAGVIANDLIVKVGGKAIVLDLRENRGGLLNQAVAVADLFLPEGQVIVSTRDRRGSERTFKSKKKDENAAGTFLPLPGDPRPVAVLVNRESASASEI